MNKFLGLLLGGFVAVQNRYQKRKQDYSVKSRPEEKKYIFKKAKASRKMARISRRINRK